MVHTLKGHAKHVKEINIIDDKIVSADNQNLMIIWSLSTKEKLHQIQMNYYRGSDFIGKKLATIDENTIKMFALISLY